MQHGQSLLLQTREELQCVRADFDKERAKREELEAALKEAKVGLDVKDKVCATIRNQVESLGSELEQVQ